MWNMEFHCPIPFIQCLGLSKSSRVFGTDRGQLFAGLETTASRAGERTNVPAGAGLGACRARSGQ